MTDNEFSPNQIPITTTDLTRISNVLKVERDGIPSVAAPLWLVVVLPWRSWLLNRRRAYASKIYPNIWIGDVDVGGMTPERREAPQARVDEFDKSCAHYTYEDLEPSLTDLGVRRYRCPGGSGNGSRQG